MLSALGQLLPLAAAMAVSSVPIMVTMLLLLSPKRNQVAIPFLIGWLAAMAGVVVLAAIGANALPVRQARTPQASIAVAEIIIGVAALIGAVLGWRRAAPASENTPNKWLQIVERIGPLTAVGLGIVLNLRPKGLLIGVAAGLAIAGSRLAFANSVIVICIYVALSSSSVMIPILVTLASPARMEPRLVAAQDWLDHNGRYITAVVLFMLGFIVLGFGLGRL